MRSGEDEGGHGREALAVVPVHAGGDTSPTPSAPSRTEKPSVEPTGDRPAPRTQAGAIQRYEQYLHALGREDIDVVFQMISPVQKKALQTATVDPQRIIVCAPDKIDMPAEAVRASVTFSESELGNSTLEYLKND
ncbi:hypothetical protein [Streptomyces sp. NPDC057748]|uniref:hypothetical protein n=1 Tax=unclassified Streptomyces TaxID=2593676 RepID=UPI0036CC205B